MNCRGMVVTLGLLVGFSGCKTKSTDESPEVSPAEQVGSSKPGQNSKDGDGSQSVTPPINQVFDGSSFNHCVAKTIEKNRVKVTNYDVLLTEQEQAFKLTAKVESRTVLGMNRDLEGQTFDWKLPTEFSVQEPSNRKSDKQGMVSVDVKRPVSQGSSVVCTTAMSRSEPGLGRVFVVNSSAPVFVVDIDEVISNLPEIQVPLRTIENSPVVEGAPEALREISKTHLIVYLSARDDALLNHTRVWLHAKGFPAGPTFVWDWRAKNQFGLSRAKQGAFKTQFLGDLKKRFPNIAGGIGNRPHDAAAYQSAGVQPWIIRAKEDPSKFVKGTRFVKQWNEVLKP